MIINTKLSVSIKSITKSFTNQYLIMRILTVLIAFVFIGSLLFAQEGTTTILITNVNVWDGTSDNTIQADVLIEGNKFKEIKSGIKAPKGATTIDGQGGTLIPGLIDMHQHLMLWGGTTEGTYEYDAYGQGARAIKMAERLLEMGYTTIRDIGGNSLSISRLILEGK